jgi:MoaD family protein
MKVKVRSMASFRYILGKERDVDLSNGSTVGSLLNILCAAHGELQALLFEGSELKEDVNILVSGKNIESLKGMKTELSDGDEVVLFPAAIGG